MEQITRGFVTSRKPSGDRDLKRDKKGGRDMIISRLMKSLRSDG